MNQYLLNAKKDQYYGFDDYSFEFNKRETHIILPKTGLENNMKWIWRAEFYNCGFDTVDVEMLNRGYALVYHRVSDMYGCPEAIKLMHIFYSFLMEIFSLNKKTILLGFSRGGLYSVNYALSYPDEVAALYLDAPVLDIRSWPGGLGVGLGDGHCYEECLKWYGLDRSSALTFNGNPINNVDKLISYRIPVVLVAGDSDRDVPLCENGEYFNTEYGKTDVPFLYIVKKGCDHHPHSLEDPTEICDFLVQF